jgi:hypothetical protein
MAVIGRTLHDLVGLRYEDGDGGSTATGTGEQQTATGAGADGGQAGAGATGTGSDAQDVASLPAWAQKVITDARNDAARYRTGSETAATAAAEKAQQELVDKIAVAAGLKKDAATDPAALTQQLTQAQEAQKATERRLAVYAAAADTAQANALLNRLDFTNSIAGLDPADEAAFTAAVKAAVDADNSLKTTRAVGASTADTGTGSGEGQPITEAQLAQMTPEQIDKAFREGRLSALLG